MQSGQRRSPPRRPFEHDPLAAHMNGHRGNALHAEAGFATTL